MFLRSYEALSTEKSNPTVNLGPFLRRRSQVIYQHDLYLSQRSFNKNPSGISDIIPAAEKASNPV